MLIQDSDIPPLPYMVEANHLIYKSDEITYYALLCMAYRATPSSVNPTYNPVIECIKCARAALDCHKTCTIEFKGKTEFWAVYLNW
jgi:hypothetical protein